LQLVECIESIKNEVKKKVLPKSELIVLGSLIEQQKEKFPGLIQPNARARRGPKS
jgi:hypothetical protein